MQHPVKLGEEQRLLNYRQFYRFYFRMREYGSIDDVTKDEIRRYVFAGVSSLPNFGNTFAVQ